MPETMDSARIISWATDEEGRIAYVDPQWEAFTGQAEKEAVGFGWLATVHSEDSGPAEKAVKEAAKTRTSVRFMCRIRTAGGAYRRVIIAGAPRITDGGVFIGLVGAVVEAEESEKARQRASHRADLIDLAFEPIFVWDMDSGITDWNKGCELLYGFSRAEAVGRISHELLRTRFPVSQEDFETRLQRNGEWSGELHHFSKDGAEIVVESRHQLMRADGRSLVLEANRDITERKKTEKKLRLNEEALRLASDRKDAFIAVLAHELRNPLAPIRTGVDVLRREEASLTSRSRAVTQMMERQVNHLVRIVDDLLEISRITRGKLDFQKTLTDLHDVIYAAIEASSPDITRKSHRLQTSFTTERLLVDGDPVRLTQAVTNILNNAAKYTPDGGDIEISTYQQNEQAVIEIRDTGVGIPEEALPDIFDLFAQVGSHCSEYSGLGVGLALVHEIIKAHGGAVEAFSSGLNKGSTFKLRLPLAKAAAEDAPRSNVSSSPDAAARRVLVIDDNRDAAESLSILLHSLGASTRVAFNGRSGIEAAKEFEPDIILVDLGMPGLNGFETARLLRESSGGRGRLLAAITGWGQEEHRARTSAAGFDAHLTKPTSVAALQELLARPAPTPPL